MEGKRYTIISRDLKVVCDLINLSDNLEWDKIPGI